jgi:hypothetical protein
MQVTPVGRGTKAKPNQVTPVQKWIRGKQGPPLGKGTRPILVSPVGKGTREKLGQSSVTRSQAETRSVQWEEERGPNQGVQWEKEPQLKEVIPVWKGTRWKPGQNSGKRDQGQTWATYQTLFPLLIYKRLSFSLRRKLCEISTAFGWWWNPPPSIIVLYEEFWKMIFWLVLKLEISYRVRISWRILVPLRGVFEDHIFAWWNIWIFIFLLLPENTF